MSPLEIYKKVKAHLLNQMTKSYDDTTSCCMYRTTDKDGKHLLCAVGCLIPDDVYEYFNDPEVRADYNKLEEEGIEAMLSHLEHSHYNPANELYQQLQPHTDLLTRLQTIHDEREPEDWDERLSKIYNAIMEGTYGDPDKE